MKASMKRRRKTMSGIDFSDEMNRSEDVEDEEEAEPGREDDAFGMCGEGDWGGGSSQSRWLI